MINFQEIRIRNGRVFKTLDMPLDKQGIVSLLGRNGVGKSTIWGLLEAAIFSATPSGEKRDQLLQASGDASIEVDVEKSGIKYTVAYRRKKGKWSHSIFQEGVEYDLSSHSAIEAAKDARKLIGLTQEEFEGSVHLTQNSQHILISGKPSDRKNYIAEFFGIDSRFDAVKEKAAEKLQSIKDSIDRMGSLEQTRVALEAELEKIDLTRIDHLKEKAAAITRAHAALVEDLKEIKKSDQEWEVYSQLLPRLGDIANPEVEYENCISEITALKTKVSQLEALEKEYQENDTLRKQRDALNRKLETLSQYSEFSEMENVEADISRSENSIKEHTKFSPLYKELISITVPETVPDTKAIGEEKSRIYTAYRMLVQKLEALEGGRCPTCGSDYREEQHEGDLHKLATLKEELAAIENELAVANEGERAINRRKQLQEVLQGYTPPDPVTVERHLELVSQATKIRQYLAVKAELNSLPNPKDLLPPPNRSSIEKNLSILAAEKLKLQDILEVKARLVKPSSPTRPAPDEIATLESRIAAAETEKQELLKALGSLENDEARSIRLRKQLSELAAELELLPDLKKEEYLWAKMVDAYGAKGLRVQQLQKILALVMERLPFYTGILFTDRDLKFTTECDAGNIKLLVERKIRSAEGFETITYDVNSLSGGEKKRLSIALVLTLADCISHSKRSNILILDEIDANLDAEGQHLFVTELLPLLREQYSSIFVISHADEIQQAAVFDKVYKVKKSDGWSTLELERP